MDIRIIFQVIGLVKAGLPVIIDIIKAVKTTQKQAAGMPPTDKKEFCLEILKENEITENHYPDLSGAINFTKQLLRKNKVL